MKVFNYFIVFCLLVVLILAVRHHTHMNVVSKALDNIEPATISVPSISPAQDLSNCFPSKDLSIAAINASQITVDIIVKKMLQDKYIIVNKDGISYRFKMVKKYKQKK